MFVIAELALMDSEAMIKLPNVCRQGGRKGAAEMAHKPPW
jgi:hypothetical protein